jgi:S1-C subfamily serine protease
VPPERQPRGPLGRALLFLALAAVAGVVVGHFLWSSSATLRLGTASRSAFTPSRRYTPGGSSSGTGEEGGYLFGPGRAGEAPGSTEAGSSSEGGRSPEARPSEGGTSNEGSGSKEAGAAAGVSSSVTSKVDPALVDINTDLGLEGGAAAGTGMVVTSNGEVFTNNHVITGATKITATDVGNGKTYTAKVVGYDYGHDIAVLQLEGASGLRTVSFDESGSPKSGEDVATIGNAGGTGGTPTAAAGQVTGLGQSITAGDEVDGGSEQLTGLIQLSGDLQPGDSGGPLVNDSGEVVGMDTAASDTFQFQTSADEGFAIPIEEVESLAKQIAEGEGSSTIHIGATALLGVLVQSSGDEGAQVENVISAAPAAGSGLGAGDTIIALDGKTVTTPTSLTDVMLSEHPGDSVKVTWRTPEGAQRTATVTLASGPPQ